MTVTPQEALQQLEDARDELGKLSDALYQISVQLDGKDNEPGVEQQYQDFVDEHETGQWLKAQDDDGPKLPSEALRLKLARRDMDPVLLARHDLLIRKRKRVQQRISDVSKIIEANRSILSALKEEAQGAGIRRAA
ncbi:MAG: hypothetical protein KGL39_38555 [Patescibacteria group bacterium]|nr:hypothetical protein [Patescibacteria group bacterium]